MSDIETKQPRRFQLQAPYAQVRVPAGNVRIGFRNGAWRGCGFKQYAIVTEDQIHPADLEHLLQATFEVGKLETDKFGAKTLVKEKVPMLIELPPA